jgi:hypothetical protein
VLLGQRTELGVSVRVGGDGGPGEHRTSTSIDHRGRVRLAVCVDADDDLNQVCQHGHRVLLLDR